MNSGASLHWWGTGPNVTEFYLAAAGLLLLAALFVVFPRWFSRGERHLNERGANLDWYATREAELAGEAESAALLEEARLRLLEDEVDGLTEPGDGQQSWRPWWLLPPLAALAALLYVQLGGMPDVLITRDLQSLGESSTEEDYRAVLMDVEQRARQRPGNLHYQAMLGRYYMDEGDYGRARDLYLALVDSAPEDAMAHALAAQAAYLAAGRVLDDRSQVLAEQALALDPHQPTALGLLGMVAFENRQYRAAIDYWRRLLAREPPGSQTAQMIGGVIARAEAALGEAPPAATGESAVPAAGGVGVAVRVELAEGTSAGPDDTVFVFARDPASGSRMPIAVKRLRVADLPVSLYLDDAASMAGQKISALENVLVLARISPRGQPGEEFASHQGQLGPVTPTAQAAERTLVLEPKKN
jgi:cytochrome c-type biogenesis protein CcmH